ncbi:MAG: hypothetical protein NVSMB52_06320 [Chloroflexota bacterium]
MEPAVPRLHPRAVGDLLDAAFSLYRQNFALFSGIAAVLAIPQAVLGAGLGLVSGGGSVSGAGLSTGTTSSNVAGTVAFTAVNLFLGVIFAALVTGALAYAISQRYLGRTISVAEAYRAVGMRTFALLLGATLLQYASIALGAIALVIGALFLYVKLLFIPQCVVIERTGVIGAFRRSWNLVQSSWWRTFGISLVLGIITSVISGVLVGLLAAIAAISGARAGIVTGGLSPLVGIVVQPFQLTALTLLYYDLRIRKEGFDLEHLIVTIDARRF